MYLVVIYGDRIERYFNLKGIQVEPVYEEKIDDYNTIVIDSSFQYDITLSFCRYIFDISKIINNYSTTLKDKVFEYNHKFYNKAFDKDSYKDLIILLRKENYKKAHVPMVTSDGKLRVTQIRTEDVTPNVIDWSLKSKDYNKLRIVIFNETILPYVKSLIL